MSEALRKQVGSRVKELREARGLTQVQLAHLLGKALETISNFERGKTLPSLVTLEQLAGVLGVSMQDFFSDKPAEIRPDDQQGVIAQITALSDHERSLVLDIVKTVQKHNQKVASEK